MDNENPFRAEVKTGPELYALGLAWLDLARTQWDESVEEDSEPTYSDPAVYEAAVRNHEASTTGAAAIAAAAFAGAQAAAHGLLASEVAMESGDEAQSKAWLAAVSTDITVTATATLADVEPSTRA